MDEIRYVDRDGKDPLRIYVSYEFEGPISGTTYIEGVRENGAEIQVAKENTFSEDEMARHQIEKIRNSLRWLVEETDVQWTIEPVGYKEKFDGGYPVNAVVFVDSVHCDINPLAVIREDEF